MWLKQCPFQVWSLRGAGGSRLYTGGGPGHRQPDSCFRSLRLHVPPWQKGVGSWRGAELEILICNWQGLPAVPTAEPCRACQASEGFGSRAVLLITFWRLTQSSGKSMHQSWGLFGALGFAFPEEAEMDFRKNCWGGNCHIGICFLIVRSNMGVAGKYHLISQTWSNDGLCLELCIECGRNLGLYWWCLLGAEEQIQSMSVRYMSPEGWRWDKPWILVRAITLVLLGLLWGLKKKICQVLIRW